jgi:hypothetical protein
VTVPHDPQSPFARVARQGGSLGRFLLAHAVRLDLDEAALARTLGCAEAALLPLAVQYWRRGSWPADPANIAARYGADGESLLRIANEESGRADAEQEAAERAYDGEHDQAEADAADAAWDWFLGFCARVPAMAAQSRALEYVRRRADPSGVLPDRPTAAQWFQALPAHAGQDLINQARRAARDGYRTAANLIDFVNQHYFPTTCAFGRVRALPDDVRAWNDGTVPRLAAAARAGDAGAAAVLHDALLDAGCEDEELMAHVRLPGAHPAWCWALHAAALPVGRRSAETRAREVAPEAVRATSGARHLAGVRLGRVERGILLDLLGGRRPHPVGDTRSAQVVHRRALARLERLGLVGNGEDRLGLTDLGRTLVARHWSELAAGRRIRWS